LAIGEDGVDVEVALQRQVAGDVALVTGSWAKRAGVNEAKTATRLRSGSFMVGGTYEVPRRTGK
jgi:hypothetical protein